VLLVLFEMIESAEEFRRLRESENPEEYGRAAHDEAPIEVWLEVIRRWPDMCFWVAQNKSVPLEVLETLANDPDWRVRDMVSRKGSWRRSRWARTLLDMIRLAGERLDSGKGLGSPLQSLTDVLDVDDARTLGEHRVFGTIMAFLDSFFDAAGHGATDVDGMSTTDAKAALEAVKVALANGDPVEVPVQVQRFARYLPFRP
jgi:hypothetical protein